MGNKIAYLGKPGSFSHLAAKRYTDKNQLELELVSTPSFDDLVKVVLDENELGIMPIINSSGGIVPALDLIIDNELRIIGEDYIPIVHNLIGWVDQANLNEVVVHSHPQALIQCKDFISKNGLIPEKSSDTASAVQQIAELSDNEKYKHVAIGREDAACLYNVPIIQESIQDNSTNTTRFLIVRHPMDASLFDHDPHPGGNLKVTISYEVRTYRLLNVLQIIKDTGYRLYTIHTRCRTPDEGSDRVFKQIFYSDMATGGVHTSVANLKDMIEASVKDCKVQILGVYESVPVIPKDLL
jgi:prephenate dehydratase